MDIYDAMFEEDFRRHKRRVRRINNYEIKKSNGLKHILREPKLGRKGKYSTCPKIPKKWKQIEDYTRVHYLDPVWFQYKDLMRAAKPFYVTHIVFHNRDWQGIANINRLQRVMNILDSQDNHLLTRHAIPRRKRVFGRRNFKPRGIDHGMPVAIWRKKMLGKMYINPPPSQPSETSKKSWP